MANRTEPLDHGRSIHGTNPENLLEKIVQYKIRQSTYWKIRCFGLTAETLVDRAMELDHTGGTHGGSRRPTPFLCLALKMLEIQPKKDIVVEFIQNEDYKYVRLLGAFYLRLTGTNADVYRYLEPLYNDYRKIRHKLSDGKFAMTHVDEFVGELLTKANCCDTALPRIQNRWVLEACGTLEPRISVLGDDFEEDKEDGAMDVDEPNTLVIRRTTKKRDRGMDRDRKHERPHRYRDHDRDHDYDMNYWRGQERDRGREINRDRDHHHIRENYYYLERDREDRERRRRRSRRNANSRGRAEDDDPREEYRRKVKKEKKGNGNAPDPNDPEIIVMNMLRASLGLKPLK